jgi:FHA domain-containing protein
VIKLTVISFNGAPSADGLTSTFDELGGTIGRADTNQFVLPDPERTISRVHAQVAFRNGKFVIVNRGSNPISVNGRPVGSGGEAPIHAADQIEIGGYLLEVRQETPTKKAFDDPFADLLGPGAAPNAASPGGRAGAGQLIDPLGDFGHDPLPKTGPAVYPRSGPAPSPPAAPAAAIPEDWDPFAPDPAPGRPAAPDLARSLGQKVSNNLGLDGGAAAPSPLIPDLAASAAGSANDNSLDSLFGLKPGSAGDPLANSVLDNLISKPNMAASPDPLQSLNSAPRASTAAASDAFSDLQQPFIAPRAVDARLEPPPVAAPEPKPPAPALPAGAVLSWDNAGGDGRTLIRPAARAAEPPRPSPGSQEPACAPTMSPEATAEPAMPFRVDQPIAAKVPDDRPVQATVRSAPTTAAAGDDALLQAFREGLGASTVQIDALTPDLMRLVGQLLRESAQGTVDLLVARAALKREVRAESTMIVARENNPLKFSPSGDAALHHLLSPPTRGFMAAAPAMRDAYDDLRAHQFGFIAGMRAALEGVLARFDPAELEGRLTQRSVLQTLLPGSRKARMWEVFVEHFEHISNEAADDFHTLFGKAFLKAYEEHIDQLQREGN